MTIKFTDLLNRPKSEAIQVLQDEYIRTRDLPTLYNLNLVLLDVGDWQRAKSNCFKIINEQEYTCETDFIKMGMIEWFLGNTSSAIDFWKQSMNTQYAACPGAVDGPLILWYAGQQLGDEKLVKESLKKLKRYWKVPDYRVWRGWQGTVAIAGFLLNWVPVNVFLYEWKNEIDALEHRRMCRANFWVGMKCLKEGDETTVVAYFKSAFSCPKIAMLEYEYFLAKWEYSRLTGENLWPDSIY